MKDSEYFEVLLQATQPGPRAEQALRAAFARNPAEGILAAEDLLGASSLTAKCLKANRRTPPARR